MIVDLVMQTSCDDDRTERCRLVFHDGDLVFETLKGTRPNFRVERDSSVTLLPANHHSELDGFGRFVRFDLVDEHD